MKDSWATFGIDLHLELGGPRRRKALEGALREAVADGRLPAGTRLPSSRSLAADLGLARNTVVEAYAQLTAEGWLAARHGSGTTVAQRPPLPPAAPGGGAPPAPGAERWAHSLRPGGPDLSSFPRTAWLAASRRAWSTAVDADLGYGDPRGTRQLREVLAGYLGRARGVRTEPSRLVICSGFTQAFGLLCSVLRAGGATAVALESHGLPELSRIASGAGLGVLSLPVDGEGADVAAIGGAEVAVLTPAHQFPLGTVLSPRRRHAALSWARQVGGLVVEDDYDGEFRYDREPLGALQGLDPDHVIYVGTASKSLAPGLRLAWLALPAHLVQPFSDAKLLADRHSSVFDQLALAELIASGAYDRHVRRQRLAYRRRRDRLVAALPAGRVDGISAGLHALVRLPSGMSEAVATAEAGAHGLYVEGLDSYRTGPAARPPALVIGYATPPEHAYGAALMVLQDVLALGAGP